MNRAGSGVLGRSPGPVSLRGSQLRPRKLQVTSAGRRCVLCALTFQETPSAVRP